MFTTKSRRIIRPSAASIGAIPTICVVDPKADDYRDSDTLVQVVDAQVQYVATAEQALRLANARAVDLWVINTELPGLSGFELCSMLKHQHSAICLVADAYSPAAEQAAWQARATLFACKTTLAAQIKAWFEHWREKRSQMSGDPRPPQRKVANRAIATR